MNEPHTSLRDTSSNPTSSKKPSTAQAIVSENLDVMAALGGWRGIIESVVPTLIFLVLYIATHATMMAVAVALAVCVLAILVRAIQAVPISPALGGLIAMGISAVLVWRTGEASDVFLWGILTNAAYGIVLLGSIAVRWPLLGVLIAAIKGEGMSWRTGSDTARIRRRYYSITWIWVAMFALRLAIELPLYMLSATEALGIAKLILGLPLFALTIWFSWLMVHSLAAPGVSEPSEGSEVSDVSEPSEVAPASPSPSLSGDGAETTSSMR